MWPAGELCPRAKPRERCALGSVRASCDYSGVSVECRELPSETINERLSVVNDALCRSRTPLVYSGVVCVCFGLSSESLSNVGLCVGLQLWREWRVAYVCRTFVGRVESSRESAYVCERYGVSREESVARKMCGSMDSMRAGCGVSRVRTLIGTRL